MNIQAATKRYSLKKGLHNKLFPKRLRTWRVTYKYEVEGILVGKPVLYLYRLPTFLYQVLFTMLFPLLVLWCGIPAAVSCLAELWLAKNHGVDCVTGGTENFKNFMALAKEIRN